MSKRKPKHYRENQKLIGKTLATRKNEEFKLFENEECAIYQIDSYTPKLNKLERYLRVVNKIEKIRGYVKIQVSRYASKKTKEEVRDQLNKYHEIGAMQSMKYLLSDEVVEGCMSGKSRIYVHRLIAFLDGKKIKGFEVHHIDRNSENNRADNLVLLNAEAHERLHDSRYKSSKLIQEEFNNRGHADQMKAIISVNSSGAIDINDYKQQREEDARRDIKNISSERLYSLLKGFKGITYLPDGGERLVSGYDKGLLRTLEAWYKVKIEDRYKTALLGQIRGRVGDYYRKIGWSYNRKANTWEKTECRQMKMCFG